MGTEMSWASTGSGLAYKYFRLTNRLAEGYGNIIPKDLITSFCGYTTTIYKVDLQDEYSQPMPWIGLYIALASLACILTMVLDVLHAFRTRRLWFPCKYFTLNAASLSMIAVAIKLPMDISESMPTTIDQLTKIGSMAFLCTMIVNLLPSLASMDSHQLVTNIFALFVMVITLVVNVCIQMYTGVVASSEDYRKTVDLLSKVKPASYAYIDQSRVIASIYVAMILFLLTIHICSALALLESKRLLESKYQEVQKKTALKEEDLKTLDVEKLKEHVSNHWIMAETGSPQLMAVCSVTTCASGVICVLGAILYLLVMLFAYLDVQDHGSDYAWSIPTIFIIQFSGVILGTVAPVSRCLASLNFNLSENWIRDHINVFKVESYWIQKLSDLKHGSIPFQFHSHKFMHIIKKSQILILDIWIVIQILVVVSCKTLALIPIFYMVCWKRLKAMFSNLEENAPQIIIKDDDDYVVQLLQDDMKPVERTLKRIKKSLDNKIKKAEKQQPKNLMKLLLRKSTSSSSSSDVKPLLSEGYPECWSLPLVTLCAIAASLRSNIRDDHMLKWLLTAVSEGVVYVRLVEKSLINAMANDEYRRIQKAAKKLWVEVEVESKWLENKLLQVKDVDQPPHHKGMDTTREILEWFSSTSKKIIANPESKRTSTCICIDIGTATSSRNENITFCRKVCAESMDRVTQFIMTYYQKNNISIDRVSQEMLLDLLSSLMADILAACLTNLPQAIAMKCYTKMIEKREESVHAAAQFLGETTQIIQYLQQGELNSDEFIQKPTRFLPCFP